MNQYDSVEAELLLETLMKKRQENLSQIATVQLLDRRGEIISAAELVDIVYDNSVTDAYLQRFFGQGMLAMPSETEELHFKRCEDSGVEFCICMPDRQILPEVKIL